jgi:tetratricopeptide (TPR) repeat protein
MRFAAEELRVHGYEDTAMTIYNQAIRWFENLPAEEVKLNRFDYGITLYEVRKYQQARTTFEELVSDSSESIDYNAYLGCVAARMGDKAKAKEVSEWIGNLKRPYLFGTPSYCRACIAAILGDKEQAINFLKESAQRGKTDWMLWHHDVDLESLWDYPPFKEFMKPKG